MSQSSTRGVPIDTDALLAADSDQVVPSQKAIKAYVDAVSAGSITSLTGEVTGTGPGATAATIANNVVSDAKLRTGAATSVIGRSANSIGNVADISTSTDGQVLRRAAGVLGFGAVDLSDTDAVTGDLPLTNIAQIATDSFLGRDTAGPGDIEVLSVGTTKTLLNLTGTNSGDVTLDGTPDYITIVGQVITRGAVDLTADVTGDLPYANLVQATAASKLVGRGSAGGAGDWQEVSLGSGLSMSGTTLSASGTGDVVGDDTTVTVQNIVAYNAVGGKNITELTGTQGDVLYHNGTNWAKLGYGTSGYYLQTAGVGANPAWAAVAGGTAATQADQETSTSLTAFVSPGRQQYHPSACKVWGIATANSTTLKAGYNVSSIGDTATGRMTVNLTVSFSGSNYAAVIGAEHNSASGTTQTYQLDNGGMAAGSFIMESWQVDGTEALTDPSASWTFAAFGDQ